MNSFIENDFLLQSDIAKELYAAAEKLPIIDYHCHLSPKEIAENMTYENIAQVWLGGDHYKWRLMRQNGIDEKYITGSGSDYEKFIHWAETLEHAISNPLYHWSHLELKKYFGFNGYLTKENADEVWNLCNEKLRNGNLSAKNIIKMSNVACIGTTDDPLDTLEWHKKIREDKDFITKVIPTFRPDKLILIRHKDFTSYVKKLSDISKIKIDSFKTFCNAIKTRIDFFAENECRSSDHSFADIPFVACTEKEADEIFMNALCSKEISELDEKKYHTALMTFLASEYAKKNWVMQLHFGVTRNSNSRAFKNLGADTGFDRIKGTVDIEHLSQFLDNLDSMEALPKTVIYSLNPNDNAALDVLAGCFYETGIKGKVQHGAAWWFNDHKKGMENHLEGLCQSGALNVFIGMHTDSRSFLSYTRHEYFRRILCNFIAEKVCKKEFPDDMKILKHIVENVSYNNSREYFNL